MDKCNTLSEAVGPGNGSSNVIEKPSGPVNNKFQVPKDSSVIVWPEMKDNL